MTETSEPADWRATRLVRAADFEIEGRTVFGTVMPYNSPQMVKDPGAPPYKEAFAPGAFTRSIDQRGDKIRLYTMHGRQANRNPVGKPVEWDDNSDRLRGAFQVFSTTEGDDALTLIREGGLTGFSVGFAALPGGTKQEADLTLRTEAGMGEVSAVDVPAYAGAAIDGIRYALDIEDPDELAAFVDSLDPLTRAALAQAFASLDPQDGTDPDTAPQAPLDGDPIPYAAIAARIATL
jgi:HK97 family phage prohead protease